MVVGVGWWVNARATAAALLAGRLTTCHHAPPRSCPILRPIPPLHPTTAQVAQSVGASAVYFNNLYDPITLMRDCDARRVLEGAGLACRTFNADMLYEPHEVLDGGGQPLTTFTGFWDKVRARRRARWTVRPR